MKSSFSTLTSLIILVCFGGHVAAISSTESAAQPETVSANAADCSGTLTKFKYFGVNQSGAEFGNQNIPGVLGTDYTWPAPSSIDYFVGQGFNTFRVAFQQERISPPSKGLTGAFDATYLAALKTVSNILRTH
ncbi:hypothetical protein H0H81_005629 [Sphagnurus paluster]|uniref:cellulase n=1 Tax=Sphagnurus paluster TaxID=117069 RepID=A0A9P7FTT8_9AGAR|nr:hypothetical protein H0H81_005629 [Sphagnurus paluster]